MKGLQGAECPEGRLVIKLLAYHRTEPVKLSGFKSSMSIIKKGGSQDVKMTE